MRRIRLGLSLVAAGFGAALMITTPAFNVAAQMGGGSMQGQGMGMMQHGAETPATQAYMAAMMRMHNDMGMQFTGDPDVDFAQLMIPHHQGAIDMARVVLQYGNDPEMRN